MWDASFNKDLSNEPTFGRIISLDSTFKGLSLDGGRADFSKNPPGASFNKDLLNASTFCRIHLTGQYL
jgi:hypothetical protein